MGKEGTGGGGHVDPQTSTSSTADPSNDWNIQDLEHLKELQEKLRHAQEALHKHTEAITKKAAEKAKQ